MKKMMLGIALVLLLRSSVDLLAQETPHLVPGTRVRVSVPDLDLYRLVGGVECLTADTLVLETDGRGRSGCDPCEDA